jgi:hypothetical protein
VRRFDIVLVLGYFRSATAYLSIIRHLSPTLRIAVLPVDTEPALRQKTGEAEDLFLRVCRDFGAEIVDTKAEINARLMIVQQFAYTGVQVSSITTAVAAARRVGLMTLAMAGVEKFDGFVEQFGLTRVYVASRRFMEFLLERRNATGRYRTVDVEEVGLPFASYPVFPDFHVDWLIAAPTLFSFSTEAGKQTFLDCVLKLMTQMPPDAVVAYKPHNGNKLDYFVPAAHYRLAAVFMRIPGGDALLRALSSSGPTLLRLFFNRTLTSVLHQKVLRRAVPMIQITPYADLSLEAFLPGVREGVIGGLSNTIWGTLYFGLPFFNCVDPAIVNHGESELLAKSSEALLKMNLEYFGVPYCGGDLRHGARGEQIVMDSDRRGDLIEAVKADLAAAS